jgi:hypothetical protein
MCRRSNVDFPDLNLLLFECAHMVCERCHQQRVSYLDRRCAEQQMRCPRCQTCCTAVPLHSAERLPDGVKPLFRDPTESIATLLDVLKFRRDCREACVTAMRSELAQLRAENTRLWERIATASHAGHNTTRRGAQQRVVDHREPGTFAVCPRWPSQYVSDGAQANLTESVVHGEAALLDIWPACRGADSSDLVGYEHGYRATSTKQQHHHHRTVAPKVPPPSPALLARNTQRIRAPAPHQLQQLNLLPGISKAPLNGKDDTVCVRRGGTAKTRNQGAVHRSRSLFPITPTSSSSKNLV